MSQLAAAKYMKKSKSDFLFKIKKDLFNIDCYLLFQWITMNFDIPCRSQLVVLRSQHPIDIIRLIA
ncbi:hypothetical protein ALC56_10496 [Trachymyrmex septentrionalis]|uniref:Uncharacterized protein n=1 Tax=Trachymyrmex septentrionalis TaxID=34720 RepID=A0A195F4L0_9HYME|nr:hypothetical protein ALC56_10496 [Trachymyrmex septentrionalis]